MEKQKLLAAIMFADIVGYTAIMQEDEAQAMKFRDTFKVTINLQVGKYRGKIIQYYGDGCLTIFRSGAEAVQCAMEVQKAFHSKFNLPVRIGIHSGDITLEQEGAYGDSINLTSRIESFAVPGSVLFSEKVYDEIKNQPGISSISLGTFQLKNVQRPICIHALNHPELEVPDPDQLKGKGKKLVTKQSIAVLAFENLSNDPEQDYFARGISDEIINVLTKLPGLKVAGRTSAFSFQNKSIDLRKVGHELNVQTVLEGSVRKAGKRIRISVQLINAADGFHLWSERYDRELEDVFAIQDDISERIVSKLKLTLFDSTHKKIKTRHTQSIDAYEWYLRGRHFLDQRAHMDKAIQCFEKALECDEKYALAYSGLAYSHFYQIVFGKARPNEEFPKANEAVNVALSLDPEVVEAHLVKGIICFYYESDKTKALKYYRKAESLAPNYYDTYRVMAYFFSMTGKSQTAIKYAAKAFDLDPLNINAKLSLAEILYRSQNFEKAIDLLEEIIQQFPNYGPAYVILGNSQYKQGRLEAALENIEKSKTLHQLSTYYRFSKAIILAENGNIDELLEAIELTKKTDTSWQSPVMAACLYYASGNITQARTLMDRAKVEKDPLLMMINVDPLWDNYKKDPHIQKILESVGII